MRKIRFVLRSVGVLLVLFAVLNVSGAYAMWSYIIGQAPDSKSCTAGVEFLFPIPTKGLMITDENNPGIGNTVASGNLWGAQDLIAANPKDKDSRDEFLLTNYKAFEIGVANQTEDPETDFLVTFEITLCLCEDYLLNTGGGVFSYPFQDAFTVSRNGTVIDSGVLFYDPNDEGITTGDVEIKNTGTIAFYKYYGIFSNYTPYYYYTATIDRSTMEALGWDIDDYVVEAGEVVSFEINVVHTQSNDTACFASVEVMAQPYS